MTVSSIQLRAPRIRPTRDRGIIAIGIFKLLQAALFILLGVGAIRLLHKDLMSVAEHFILAVRFNPESHFVNLMMDKVAMIDPHRMRQISAVIFAVAALDIIEGTGGVCNADPHRFVFTLGDFRNLPAHQLDAHRAHPH
jgi:uncharacterized membrane protein (DUF2068 family)